MTAQPIRLTAMHRTSSVYPLLIAALVAPLIALEPARADTKTLDLSRNGFVCDRSQKICYNSRGASTEATRNEFGSKAERDLVNRLSGKPRQEEIRFSTGAECDLRQQICWEDGRKRKNVSQQLNKQLFGNSSGGSTQSWRNPADDTATCQLSDRNRRIFSGRCDLQRRATSSGTSYVVDLRDGRRYTFYNRMGRLVMSDATGTYPVTYSTRGRSTVFRWANMELETYRNDSGSNSSGRYPDNRYQDNRYPNNSYPDNRYPSNQYPGYGNPSSGGSGLQNLIENLFR
ncbi:hypothetical protein VB716_09025 [Synechococcus sp. CCY9201]|uniref:YcgJ family protein n=1 Tax=unclassified Synechococcus TaxID=2626047 RepID=UPI002B2217D1|nr:MULTISPECIES: hypothetical protein [unclassified Synechococcus]MEA5424509.1 hypothetical protein [Synechococcus sp. CCY9202]MEA5474363.1 hypothetical protein [Synechococcus sp. CCY9201]